MGEGASAKTRAGGGEGSWKESIFVIFLNEWNVYIVDGELCILVVAVGWARRLMIGNH